MSFFHIYVLVAVGIALSIVLPFLKKLLPKGRAAATLSVWESIKPYVIVGLFSLLTAILVVAFAGDSLQDWRAAILAGYAWDSTLQKLTT